MSPNHDPSPDPGAPCSKQRHRARDLKSHCARWSSRAPLAGALAWWVVGAHALHRPTASGGTRRSRPWQAPCPTGGAGGSMKAKCCGRAGGDAQVPGAARRVQPAPLALQVAPPHPLVALRCDRGLELRGGRRERWFAPMPCGSTRTDGTTVSGWQDGRREKAERANNCVCRCSSQQ